MKEMLVISFLSELEVICLHLLLSNTNNSIQY